MDSTIPVTGQPDFIIHSNKKIKNLLFNFFYLMTFLLIIVNKCFFAIINCSFDYLL